MNEGHMNFKYNTCMKISDLLDKWAYLNPHFNARYMSNEGKIQAQIKQEVEDVCDSVIQESNEPEHSTTGV